MTKSKREGYRPRMSNGVSYLNLLSRVGGDDAVVVRSVYDDLSWAKDHVNE